MSNDLLDQAFETHAQDYLCSESYDYIKEVSTRYPATDCRAHTQVSTEFRMKPNPYCSNHTGTKVNVR